MNINIININIINIINVNILFKISKSSGSIDISKFFALNCNINNNNIIKNLIKLFYTYKLYMLMLFTFLFLKKKRRKKNMTTNEYNLFKLSLRNIRNKKVEYTRINAQIDFLKLMMLNHNDDEKYLNKMKIKIENKYKEKREIEKILGYNVNNDKENFL